MEGIGSAAERQQADGPVLQPPSAELGVAAGGQGAHLANGLRSGEHHGADLVTDPGSNSVTLQCEAVA